MTDNIFFDTNILVYGFDAADPRKHEISSHLTIQAFEQGTGVISAQVLKEFYITVTKKIARTMVPDKVEQVIRDFALWRVVETTVSLIFMGIRIHVENRISFWDAMIVAAAKKAGCPILYTEDLDHGAMIAGIRVHNPFTEDR